MDPSNARYQVRTPDMNRIFYYSDYYNEALKWYKEMRWTIEQKGCSYYGAKLISTRPRHTGWSIAISLTWRPSKWFWKPYLHWRFHQYGLYWLFGTITIELEHDRVPHKIIKDYASKMGQEADGE